jgi:hypothetical protein
LRENAARDGQSFEAAEAKYCELARSFVETEGRECQAQLIGVFSIVAAAVVSSN